MKEPYPNKLLTISLDAINKPNAAGTDRARDSSKDLFCRKSSLDLLLFFTYLLKFGRIIVPIAIPAIARLI